ncbi:MAG: ATP-binding protein [Caulobacterales bacterium]|nr:ATP-binding protein [Caulobacterales bacterium]
MLRRLRVRAFRARIKDLLPKSLYGRAMLIIVAPIAMMQVAVAWSFFDAHWETVTSRLSESVAGDIAVVLDLYEQEPTPERLQQVAALAARTMSLSLAIEPEAELPLTVRSSFFRVLDRTLRRALSDKLTHAYWFDTTRYPAYVDIRVAVDAGVLRIIVPRDRVFATTGHIFLLWIVGASSLLTAVSLIYIRNQAKPIERLAEAAERFGRGQDAPNFRASGASEVRQAARAFIDMRRRIKRHIEQRTTLLAGVSHDLRTPLTRLKLQLALSPQTEEVKEMRRDLSDMEEVLEDYLAFASGMGGEDPEPTDLGDLAREVAEQAGCATDDIAVAPDEDLVVAVRAAAMKRCLQNLVGNAAYHGERVTVSARRANGSIEIDVDDDGPGIEEELREEAFRPFNQLTPAGRGGSIGLGLAIARDVARGHGGDISLGESPLGGLRATVRVPV